MRLFARRKYVSVQQRAVTRQIAAWCLHYPDDDLCTALDLLSEAATELGSTPAAHDLGEVVRHLRTTPTREAEQHYVEVFDTSPRRGLHLSWYVDGDTRRRGATLADLAGWYERHGFRPRNGELPDYLPGLLEFAALAPGTATVEVEQTLARFRPALEMLHGNLDKLGTVYARAVSAVLSTVEASATKPAEPPPLEHVGLDSYPVTQEGTP